MIAGGWTMAVKQTAGRNQLGDFAPEFARLNDDILFGEVWSREDQLSLRDRSLVTVVALMTQGLTDSSFRFHLETARKNGITKTEIAEILTHAAFYAGWPKAWAAFRMAKEVWNEAEPDGQGEHAERNAQGTGGNAAAALSGKEKFQKEILFPIGKPNDAFAQYFAGQSYLAPVSTKQVMIYNVTFEPACRNNWHIHHAASGGGQMLVCVGGRGWYQEEGKEAVELTPGRVVNIPAEVKHWHGAASDSWMAHLAIEVAGTETSNEWCEPVSDEEYGKLH
jgi:4-carboxymuconolactone decarboxylase